MCVEPFHSLLLNNDASMKWVHVCAYVHCIRVLCTRYDYFIVIRLRMKRQYIFVFCTILHYIVYIWCYLFFFSLFCNVMSDFVRASERFFLFHLYEWAIGKACFRIFIGRIYIYMACLLISFFLTLSTF